MSWPWGVKFLYQLYGSIEKSLIEDLKYKINVEKLIILRLSKKLGTHKQVGSLRKLVTFLKLGTLKS